MVKHWNNTKTLIRYVKPEVLTPFRNVFRKEYYTRDVEYNVFMDALRKTIEDLFEEYGYAHIPLLGTALHKWDNVSTNTNKTVGEPYIKKTSLAFLYNDAFYNAISEFGIAYPIKK